jgi:hypothetical protein
MTQLKTTRLFLLAILSLALLAGCSRSTVLTLDVDVLAFLPTDSLEGSLPISGEVFVPSAEGLAGSELGVGQEVLHELLRFEVQLAVQLSSDNADDNETVMLAFHLAPEKGDPYSSPAIAQETVLLAGGEPALVDLTASISETEDKAVPEMLRKGNFRFGIRLNREAAGADAGDLHYTLEVLDLRASTRGASLIGF